MVKKSSSDVKKKINDTKSEALDKIETIKKEASGKRGGKKSEKAGKQSVLILILSFFEDMIKRSGEVLLAFAELGMISKNTVKNIKHKVMKSFVFVILLVLGAVFFIRGVVMYLEHVFPQFANGTSFVFVGLVIMSIAYLYNK
ncbi:MAG: hypothetical protein KAI18_02350 [Candidatus Aenigmarchaeota archaeon]|nr:hypothetical protein [Candidatus Aenigmarchaeota archaeon]